MGFLLYFNLFCCYIGLRWAWWTGERWSVWRKDSWQGRGLLGVDDRLNRSGQAPHHGWPSSSPLTSIIGTGSLKWIATAKSIIFETLSHKASRSHLQLCLKLVMSFPSRLYLLCLIVHHLPAKWAASRGKAFHLSVRAKIDWEWQHQKKREKNGLKWRAQGQSVIESKFKLHSAVWPMGLQRGKKIKTIIRSFPPFSFPTFQVIDIVCC